MIEIKYKAAWYAGTVLSCMLYFSGIIGLYKLLRTRSQRHIAVVLMYHRVSDDGNQPDITVSTRKFERHMSYLAGSFDVVTIDEIVGGYISGRKWEKDVAAVTFDDGFKDNYTDAYPILKKYRIPATVFVATDHIGSDIGLSRDEIILMHNGNITFGAHTISHPVLSSLDRESAIREISGSKSILEDILKSTVSYFAYPYGKRGRDFNDVSMYIVRECGFKAAFATDNGFLTLKSSRYALNRIGMRDFPLFVLRARVSGIFESRLFYALRRLARI